MSTPAKPPRARRVQPKQVEAEWATAELKQMDPPCNHCYCQPADAVNGVPHNGCCKCVDTMKAPYERPTNPTVQQQPLFRRKKRIADDEQGRPLPV